MSLFLFNFDGGFELGFMSRDLGFDSFLLVCLFFVGFVFVM